MSASRVNMDMSMSEMQDVSMQGDLTGMDFVDRIPGWFAAENRDTLSSLIAKHSVTSVIEIGSFLGKSAVWFGLHPEITEIFCVDRWFEFAETANSNNLVSTLTRWGLPRDFFHLFRDNILAAGLFDKVIPIRGDSRDVHPLVTQCDLVYIDGSHDYAGCRSDVQLYGPKARKVICGDDFDDVEGWGVRRAVLDVVGPVKSKGRFWWVEVQS